MKVTCHEIDDALHLTPCDPQKAVGASRNTGSPIWINLQSTESAEFAEWLERLGIDGLSRKLCLEAGDRSGFYPLNGEIFFVLPVLIITGNTIEVDHVVFLCRERLLLTLHHLTAYDPRDLSTVEDSEAWLPERSIAGLVSAILFDQSIVNQRHTAELRKSISVLEDRMVRDPDTVTAEEILEVRSALLEHDAVVSEQLPTLQALSVTDKPFFSVASAREDMDCALANVRAADGSLDRLDQRIGELRNGFQMHAQDKTNRKLNFLTILSAIFTPITLLAGVWGMNFVRMPELQLSFGYPVALGLMAVIGAGMFFFFRRTGWFD